VHGIICTFRVLTITACFFVSEAGKVNRIVDQKALHDVMKIMQIHKADSDVMREAFLVVFAMILSGNFHVYSGGGVPFVRCDRADYEE